MTKSRATPSRFVEGNTPSPRRNRSYLALVLGGLVFGAACLIGQCVAEAALSTSVLAQVRAAAQDEYDSAIAAYTNNPASVAPAWQFGRACFDLAEVADTKKERASLAERGISACRHALELSTNCGPAQYYWGMNLGQIARTKGMGALSMVHELLRHFEAARNIEPGFDSAGPDRNLGYLYRDTPSLFSIGDARKAKEHLRAAVELAPAFPENRLALAEGYLGWGEHEEAKAELLALEKSLAAARERLTGPMWEMSWADWNSRLAKLKSKLGKS